MPTADQRTIAMDYPKFVEIVKELAREEEFSAHAHLLPAIPPLGRDAFISLLGSNNSIQDAAKVAHSFQYPPAKEDHGACGDVFTEIAD